MSIRKPLLRYWQAFRDQKGPPLPPPMKRNEQTARADAAEAELAEARRQLQFFTDGGQTITVGKEFLAGLEADLAEARRERDDAIRGRDDLPMSHVLLARLEAAEAENARLRAALEEIVALRIFHRPCEIARAALASGSEGDAKRVEAMLRVTRPVAPDRFSSEGDTA